MFFFGWCGTSPVRQLCAYPSLYKAVNKARQNRYYYARLEIIHSFIIVEIEGLNNLMNRTYKHIYY